MSDEGVKWSFPMRTCARLVLLLIGQCECQHSTSHTGKMVRPIKCFWMFVRALRHLGIIPCRRDFEILSTGLGEFRFCLQKPPPTRASQNVRLGNRPRVRFTNILTARMRRNLWRQKRNVLNSNHSVQSMIFENVYDEKCFRCTFIKSFYLQFVLPSPIWMTSSSLHKQFCITWELVYNKILNSHWSYCSFYVSVRYITNIAMRLNISFTMNARYNYLEARSALFIWKNGMITLEMSKLSLFS